MGIRTSESLNTAAFANRDPLTLETNQESSASRLEAFRALSENTLP